MAADSPLGGDGECWREGRIGVVCSLGLLSLGQVLRGRNVPALARRFGLGSGSVPEEGAVGLAAAMELNFIDTSDTSPGLCATIIPPYSTRLPPARARVPRPNSFHY
jgi:hypothetical protein